MVRVIISGVHSGPSPSAGVGVARCLLDGVDDIHLTGVDYSRESTGLEWPGFNRIAVPGPWSQLDLDEYAGKIRGLLDEGHLWVSCLDLECRWLADKIGDHPNCCSPRSVALAAIEKPGNRLALALDLSVPDYIYVTESDERLFDFVTYHSRVWVKGPFYGAIGVSTWPQLKSAVGQMQAICSTRSGVYVQKEVVGIHYSIAFAAWRGRLLNCLGITKESTTLEGKTWTGKVETLSDQLREALAVFCQDVSWCGGGEIECICDEHNHLWLLECNSRFPAWIYGASLCGYNLPASLVGAVAGRSIRPNGTRSSRFTRIVLEVPARDNYADDTVESCINGLAKEGLDDDIVEVHPSGMASLAKRLTKNEEPPGLLFDGESIIRCLEGLPYVAPELPTPSRIFLPETARRNFLMVSARQQQLAKSEPLLRFAYSIKTNPDPRMLAIAIENGLWGEAISQLEVSHAIACGWTTDRLILNGPGKWWPSMAVSGPVAAVFCDSLEELERVVASRRVVSRILGLRIRPTNLQSRFGVPISDHEAVKKVGAVLSALPKQFELGLHFHLPGNHIGSLNWVTLVASFIETARAIRDECGRPISLLDFGGGLTPGMFHGLLTSQYLETLQIEAGRAGFTELVLEPGRALAQNVMVLVTRVLDVRKGIEGNSEIVVDASTAELPDINSFPHRIATRDSSGRFNPLERGQSKLYGRLCMESDVLARNVDFPAALAVGDLLYVLDAGAYDLSMSSSFGRGVCAHLSA